MLRAMRLTTLLTVIVATLLGATARADDLVESVKIDVNDCRPFEGWGTSLCWWANGVGDWPDDRLDDLLSLIVDPEKGLGYTIFRYNIGGGEAPRHDHMEPRREMPGFKAGPDAPYDWDADANQRRVLLKLRDRVPGAVFEAFSNSPPYWMTKSGCASGAEDGGDNLRPDAEADFADYLTDVVQYYRDQHNLEFRTLSPMNEPSADWWRAGHTQEGCHVSVPQQQRLIQAVAKSLKQKQLTATGVSAPETNNLDTCLKNLRAYDAETLSAIAQINTHTYAGSHRIELLQFCVSHKKPLWQSESGPLGMKGKPQLDVYLAMAERIVADLNELKAAAWVDWQVIDGSIWGCIRVKQSDQTFDTSAKFPFYAAFTRTIRPGDSLINLDHPHVLAAISAKRRELALVIVNSSPEVHTYRIVLEGVHGLANRARLLRTSETESLVDLEQRSLTGTALTLQAAPRSLTAVRIRFDADRENVESERESDEPIVDRKLD